ncbi:MAG: hypothetical protein ACI8RD_009315 [Bacillariaceae sp.]|jgi:hypothetical protein
MDEILVGCENVKIEIDEELKTKHKNHKMRIAGLD